MIDDIFEIEGSSRSPRFLQKHCIDREIWLERDSSARKSISAQQKTSADLHRNGRGKIVGRTYRETAAQVESTAPAVFDIWPGGVPGGNSLRTEFRRSDQRRSDQCDDGSSLWGLPRSTPPSYSRSCLRCPGPHYALDRRSDLKASIAMDRQCGAAPAPNARCSPCSQDIQAKQHCGRLRPQRGLTETSMEAGAYAFGKAESANHFCSSIRNRQQRLTGYKHLRKGAVGRNPRNSRGCKRRRGAVSGGPGIDWTSARRRWFRIDRMHTLSIARATK